MSLLLLFKSSAGPSGFTLSDDIFLTANQGSFDTIELDVEELSSVAEIDVIGELSFLAQGDTVGLKVAEGISATVSTGSIAQSFSDDILISVSEVLREFDSFAYTENALLLVSEGLSANQISPQALDDTASILCADQLIADIGEPITIAVEYDDTLNLKVFEVLLPVITSATQIRHITFTAKPDHIVFKL